MTEVAFAVAERLARAGSPSPGPEARQLVALLAPLVRAFLAEPA